MKKIRLLLVPLVGLLFITQLNAQTKSGFKAGFLYSNSPNIEPIASFLPSYYFGGFHERPLGMSKHWYMSGGSEFHRAGWYRDNMNYQSLSYLSMLHALKFKLGPLYATGGYSLSFKLGEKIIVDGANIKTLGNKSRIFNVPVYTGVGLDIGPFMVELKYAYGLRKLTTDGINLSYLQLGAGMWF